MMKETQTRVIWLFQSGTGVYSAKFIHLTFTRKKKCYGSSFLKSHKMR